MDLHGTTVLVLGLGESGLAMARWCASLGATLRVWDSRDAPPRAAELAAEHPGVAVAHGELGPADLAGVGLVAKSPGLAPHDPAIAWLLKAARDSGVPVWGELDFFTRALADLKAGCGYAPRVLAITGTNGKTTTTAMTSLLVERAGLRVAMAGNVGPGMLDTLRRMTAGEAQEAWAQAWVLELSSFQLADAAVLCADAAAVLNLSQDHLDWHGDFTSYAAAKARIFGGDGLMIVNRDDALVEDMVPVQAPAKGARGKAAAPARRVLRFGLGAPQRAGDFGLVVDNGMAWLVRALPSDETIRRRKVQEEEELHLQRLMPADALRVRGRHNAANALAALALATAIGCPLAPMLHALREYAGEPHRVEFVGAIGGVEAFDDSKGTNVGATVAALDGLGADKSPSRLVVILGGDGKGQDFMPLRGPLQRHARAVALIGRDASHLEAVAGAAGVPSERLPGLPEAVRWSFDRAEPGDAVLLSPACASLDMFRHYGHRAEVFVAAVRELAAERGEMLS